MRLKISLIFAVSLLLSACTTMPWIKEQVPDVPICRHLDEKISTTKDSAGREAILKRPNPTCMKRIGESRCGYCVWSLSEREAFVGEQWNHLLEVKSSKDGRVRKKKWSTVQNEALTLPAESQAWSKAFMINICNMSNMCANEIDRWRLKFDALDSVGDALP